MDSPLERQLVVIAGKGGVGKTTLTAALGLLAAQEGRRTMLVEVGDQTRLPELFGVTPSRPGLPARLGERLASISIDPEQALLEWLQALGGRVSGRLLASSGTFQYFAAAAPGAKEVVTMVKVWRLTRGRRGGGNDLVLIDAPATGHALGLLRSPQTFGAIARVGPVARQTAQVQALLADPRRSSYVAVSLPSEMAVTETLELRDELRRHLGRELDAVIANGLLPRRFTAAELELVAGAASASRAPQAGAALAAARAVHERGRAQRNQVARLRRQGMQPVTVPHQWRARMDLAGVQEIAEHLRGRV